VKLVVRRAHPGEAAAVAELWLRARRSAAGIPPAVHSDAEVRDWVRDIVLPTQEVWVVGGQPEPMAMMVLDGEWIEQLYVAPEHLRRGLGSQLVKLAQSTRESLALWTFQANASARAFYEAHGFRVCGKPSRENEEGALALCFRWGRQPT
jgi:GNAT superfamily N-acetyltransferase